MRSPTAASRLARQNHGLRPPVGALRLLMLGPPSDIRGPLPKIIPPLISSLKAGGCEVMMKTWGRHHDCESLTDKVTGRFRDILETRRAMVQFRPDIVLVHTSHDWHTLVRDLLLLLAMPHPRPRTALHLHGSQPETLRSPGRLFFRLASRLLVRLADAVFVLSSEEKVLWEQVAPGGRFFRVANPFVGRATVTLPPQSLSRVLGPDSQSVPLLLFVGRLMQEKGLFEVLYALRHISDGTPARLLVVGDGPLVAEARTLVVSLGLQDRVVMPGYLQGDELEAAYAAATLFVLPTWWFEGFPTVITEAMQAGLPIVTTSKRGMADYLKEGTNALFVPPRDPAALADALLRLLATPDLRTKMGAANREAVKAFLPERVGREYLAVLHAVTHRAHVTRPRSHDA